MTWRVFSMGHCKLLKPKSFRWCQIIHGITLLLKKNATSFKSLAQRLIREALHHRKDFCKPRFLFFGKELPNDVGRVSPPLLSKWAALEPMLHRLHQLRAIVRATFVNLHQDFTAPFFNCHYLMDDRLEMPLFFCALALCQIIFHLREVKRGFHSTICAESPS